MTRVISLLLLAFMVLSPPGFATADDSKELRKQRHDAQQERQKQKNPARVPKRRETASMGNRQFE